MDLYLSWTALDVEEEKSLFTPPYLVHPLMPHQGNQNLSLDSMSCVNSSRLVAFMTGEGKGNLGTPNGPFSEVLKSLCDIKIELSKDRLLSIGYISQSLYKIVSTYQPNRFALRKSK